MHVSDILLIREAFINWNTIIHFSLPATKLGVGSRGGSRIAEVGVHKAVEVAKQPRIF